jgi:hypothetical protein
VSKPEVVETTPKARTKVLVKDIPGHIVFQAQYATGPVFISKQDGRVCANVLEPSGKVSIYDYTDEPGKYYIREEITWPENAPPLPEAPTPERTFDIKNLSATDVELIRALLGWNVALHYTRVAGTGQYNRLYNVVDDAVTDLGLRRVLN